MMESKVFSIKTKTMVRILKPIINKVVELDSYKAAEDDCSELKAKEVCCTMESIHTCLLQLPEFKGSEHFDKFKVALDDFYEVYELIQSQEEKRTADTSTQIHRVSRNLLEFLYELLLFEDSLVNRKIQDSLSKCQSVLCNLQRAKGNNIIIEFKNFVEEILDCRELLKAHALNLVSLKHRNLILLCGSQIQKCIPLMLKMYEMEKWTDAITYKESGSYLLSRVQWCFSELLNAINAPVPHEAEEKEECGGQFVHKMDLVLEMLASVKVEEEFNDIIPQVKHVIEELLCHTMAIAQVSVANDSANITESCQKVLHVLENIKKESASHTINLSVRQMYCYSLADALEFLEQQVNNALLRLVLEVFSEPYTPLKKLVQASCNIPVAGHHADDLKDMISVLDLQVDRIMQIGMFAMACSGDARRILGIRSCLASLESLEPELVPALTAYYLEHEQSPHRNHLKMLSNHWQSEVFELEELIDGIVDPAAFCQVTVKEVHQMVATLKISLDREKPFLKTLLLGIYNKSLKLVRHLRVSTRGMKPITSEVKMQQVIEDLYCACKECSAAMNVFLLETHEGTVFHSRLLKRCKLIVSHMKKLQPLLFEHINHTHPVEDAEDSESTCVNTFNKQGDILVFPESIHDLPLDISHSNSKTGCVFTGDFAIKEIKLDDIHMKSDEALLPYFEKGRKLRQERSILYLTPRSVQKNHQESSLLYRTVTRKAQRGLFSCNDSVNLDKHTENSLAHFSVDDSLGLEITDILERLTSLSSTLVTLNVSNSE